MNQIGAGLDQVERQRVHKLEEETKMKEECHDRLLVSTGERFDSFDSNESSEVSGS